MSDAPETLPEPLPPVPGARGGLHILVGDVWTPVPVEDPTPDPDAPEEP